MSEGKRIQKNNKGMANLIIPRNDHEYTGLNFYKLSHARMFSRPKILFLVSLLSLLNSIPTYL